MADPVPVAVSPSAASSSVDRALLPSRRRPAPGRPAPAKRVPPSPSRVITPERPRAATRTAQRGKRPGVTTRVRELPRVLLDTVAWGGFGAVVALIVIALSDVGMGRAALWAAGLSGIVVLAVAVMAVTGTHLDDLNSVTRSVERPE